jgi:hypothetical protein
MQVANRRNSKFPVCAALALALAACISAAAQSNNVPGPNDYDRFCQFITQRNIFDPNRFAVAGRPRFIPRTPRYAPSFTLVGTMSYGKGLFAFFDGNQPELQKVLYPSDGDGIAGYVLTGITSTNVTLQTADKKRTVWMKIGDSMRQEGNEWVPSGQNEMAYSSIVEGSAATADSSRTEDRPAATSVSSPALQGNDVLKKLMQQREQELK